MRRCSIFGFESTLLTQIRLKRVFERVPAHPCCTLIQSVQQVSKPWNEYLGNSSVLSGETLVLQGAFLAQDWYRGRLVWLRFKSFNSQSFVNLAVQVLNDVTYMSWTNFTLGLCTTVFQLLNGHGRVLSLSLSHLLTFIYISLCAVREFPNVLLSHHEHWCIFFFISDWFAPQLLSSPWIIMIMKSLR